MLDTLYLDKLKGRITVDQYDRFYTHLREEKEDIVHRLTQLQDAEDNYYITAKHVLALCNQAHDHFVSSEVEERRQIIKLVLSNLRLDGENLVYDALKPLDVILKSSDQSIWCARQDSNLQPTDSKSGTLSY